MGLPLLPSLAPGPGVDRPPLPAGEHSLHQTSHTLQSDIQINSFSASILFHSFSFLHIIFITTLTVPMIFSTSKYWLLCTTSMSNRKPENGFIQTQLISKGISNKHKSELTLLFALHSNGLPNLHGSRHGLRLSQQVEVQGELH